MASNIAPLQLPEWRPAPMVDWSPLNKLGDTIAEYRNKNAIAQAIQQANGNPEAAGNALGAQGFTDQAKQYLSLAEQKAQLAQRLAMHRDTVAQQQAQLAEQKRHAGVAESQGWAGLNEKPSFQKVTDFAGNETILLQQPNKPATVYWSANPNVAPGSVFGQGQQPQGAAGPQPQQGEQQGPQTQQAPQPQQPGQQQGAAVPQAPAATGEGFLASLPVDEGTKNKIRQAAKYDYDPRTDQSMRNNGRSRFTGWVEQYDPTWKQGDLPGVMKARNEFASGATRNKITAMDVGIDHMGVLEDAVKALNSGDVRLINTVRNKFLEAFGSPLPTNVQAIAPFIGSEVTKAVQGSAGALGDREEFRRPLNLNAAPDVIIGALGQYKRLMAGQLGGLEHQYTTETKKSSEDFRAKLREHTLNVLEGKSNDIQKVTNAEEANSRIQEAKDAIAKGAPRDAVMKRLRDMGVPPVGL